MKILIIGAKGQVGAELIKIFSTTSHEIVGVTRREFDCVNTTDVNSFLADIYPDLIINASAYTAVDKAEDETTLAFLVNSDFVKQLAIYCEERLIPLIHLSTDYVFDGTQLEPYKETDIPNPQGVYAQSKLGGEQAIVSHSKQHIILRVSWVFGAYGSNFVKTILNLASSREQLKIVGDQWGRPTSAQDISRVVFEIIEKINNPSFNDWGIYHYAGEGVTNWHDFAVFFLEMAREKGLDLALTSLIKVKSEEYVTKAKRPMNSVLNTNKLTQILGIQCHSWKYYLPELINSLINEEKNHELSN